MYIPGVEKQEMMPDYALESGDKFGDVPIDLRIQDLFDSNLKIVVFPNKLAVHKYGNSIPFNYASTDMPLKSAPQIRNPKNFNKYLTFLNGKTDAFPGTLQEHLDSTSGDSVPLSAHNFNNLISPIHSQYNPNKNPDKTKEYDDFRIFEKWLDQQLGPLMANQDTKLLKNYLFGMLVKRGINIADKDASKGPNEIALDLSNVKTHYALIDNALMYNDTNNIRINIPNPHFEALVVSLKHPPRILGYVPIETSNVKKFKSRNHDSKFLESFGAQYDFGSLNGMKNCVDGQCETVPVQKNLQLNLDHDDDNKAEKSIVHKYIGGSLRKSDNYNNQVFRLLTKSEPNFDTSEEGEFEKKQSIENKSPKLMKTLVKYIIGKVNEEAPEDDGTDSSHEDGPAVRIVGGSAATGSGTPLSSRGRSGLP